jgi:hypothetical protein
VFAWLPSCIDIEPEELMRRRFVNLAAATAVGAWWLATPAAQTVASQPAKPQPPLTTIVGCLAERLDPSLTDPRSPASTVSADDYFVRTPTVAIPAGATVAIGKPGTGSTTPSAGTPVADSFYRVTGLDRGRLQPHVGHRVELRGHLIADATAGTTAKTTVDANGRATTRVEQRPVVAGTLHAVSITMLSATCP